MQILLGQPKYLKILTLGVALASSSAWAGATCRSSLSLFLGSRINESAPTRSQVIDLELLRPRADLYLKAQKGEPLSYVVDPENNVYFVDRKLELADDVSWFARFRSPNVSDERLHMPIKESGAVRYDAKTKTYSFVPEHQPVDLSQEEISLMRRSLGAEGKLVTRADEGVARAKMIDCKKVFEAQKRGDKFLWDQMLTGNVLTTASIGGHDPGRFLDRDNYDLLLSDYVTTNQNTLMKSFTGRYIMLNNVRYSGRLGARLGIGLASTQVQGWTTALIVEDKDGTDASERAAQLTMFNRLWMVPSLLKSDVLDGLILRRLPDYAYNACLSGMPLRIFISPKMVRFVEGWGSSVIYYSLRDKYLNAHNSDQNTDQKK